MLELTVDNDRIQNGHHHFIEMVFFRRVIAETLLFSLFSFGVKQQSLTQLWIYMFEGTYFSKSYLPLTPMYLPTKTSFNKEYTM
jgi:hypothetical protein